MEIYDVPQLAKMLRVTPESVRSYIKDGRLIGRKVAKRYLVSEDSLRAFLAPAAKSGKPPVAHD